MNLSRAVVLTEEERTRIQRFTSGTSQTSAGLSELLSGLDDPSWAVRRAVVAALVRWGEEALPGLLEVLQERRESEARLAAAVDTLSATAADADARLLLLLDSTDPAIVCDAAQVLGRRHSLASVARLGSLTADADDNVALAAIEALGRIGGDTAMPPLIKALESRNFFRTFPAIDVLGRSGDPRAVKPMVGMLDEPAYALEAARALGRIGDPSALPALIGLLLRPLDSMVRVAAVALGEVHERHLARYGVAPEVQAQLATADLAALTRRVTQCLRSAERDEQVALCRVLGWLGTEGAVVALVDLLDPEAATATGAAEALRTLGSIAEPALIEALRHAKGDLRLFILPLLGHRASAADPVSDCLGDPSPSIRAAACETLARVGDVRFVPRLFTLLDDADARVVQCAVAAIQSLGSEVTERLTLETARTGSPRARRAAMRILGYFGYPSALPVLVAALDDPDERIRDAAIFGLPFVDAEEATRALVRASGHSEARTRAAAMRALGQGTAHDTSLVALRAGLHDPDPWVRYFACQALSRLGDVASADVIASLVSDPAGQVRVAVVEALALLRGERALSALHAAALGEDQDVRRAALLGLGTLKRPESFSILQQALGSADSATRLVALSALAEYEGPEVARQLGLGLTDADESVRSATLAILQARPGADAVAVLLAHLPLTAMQDRIVVALAQPAPGRVEALVHALGNATPETAPLLVSALAKMRRGAASRALEHAFASPDPLVRRALVPALATLGSPAARALIQAAALHDADEEVRALAAGVSASG